MFGIFSRKKKKHNEELTVLSEAISFNNPKLHEFINLLLIDRDLFLSKYGGIKEYENIDVELLTEPTYELDEDGALEAFSEFYQDSNYLIAADWRDKFEDLKPQFDELVNLLGITDFDWGGLGQSKQFENDPYESFNIFAKKINEFGFSLMSLSGLGDGCDGFVVKTSETKKLKSLCLSRYGYDIEEWLQVKT